MTAAQTIADYVSRPFGTFADLVRLQAAARPGHTAIECDGRSILYAELDGLADQFAAGLQRDGVVSRGVVAVCASSSIEYAALFIGALRTGAAISPLSPSATPPQLLAMLADSGASHLFADAAVSCHLEPVASGITAMRIPLDDGAALGTWLPGPGTAPAPVAIDPGQAFNIIYSSGTTGTPKGIVQPYSMRWPHNRLNDPPGYGPDAVAIRTGDLAIRDEDGFFTLVGRKKDMIISGGINIYPVDLEQALLAHPAVVEAAVVGAPSDQWGETPVGFVTLQEGRTEAGETLRAYANERLGRMQHLSAVRVVDRLPRNAIGKVLKRELRDLL